MSPELKGYSKYVLLFSGIFCIIGDFKYVENSVENNHVIIKNETANSDKCVTSLSDSKILEIDSSSDIETYKKMLPQYEEWESRVKW